MNAAYKQEKKKNAKRRGHSMPSMTFKISDPLFGPEDSPSPKKLKDSLYLSFPVETVLSTEQNSSEDIKTELVYHLPEADVHWEGRFERDWRSGDAPVEQGYVSSAAAWDLGPKADECNDQRCQHSVQDAACRRFTSRWISHLETESTLNCWAPLNSLQIVFSMKKNNGDLPVLTLLYKCS